MRNRLSALCAALALLTVLPAPAAPKPPSAAEVMNSANLDKFYRGQMKKQNLVGLSLVVMQDGKIVATKCYGVASRETRQPVTPDTEFAIGSITKQFTAACILLLAEDGKLSVHDPVSRFYPALTRASDITLLDLMNHVSGYQNYTDDPMGSVYLTRPTTPDAVITRYAEKPLDFEPGTRWAYSNTGYLILGRVVEKVSGQPLGKFMQARLFTPLGMTRTRYNPPPHSLGLARGYNTYLFSAPFPMTPAAGGWTGGAGALYSTPTDLAAWDLALMSGRVLKPKLLAVMTTPRLLKNGASTGYGTGQFVRNWQGRMMWWHTGSVMGFLADNEIVPSRHSAVIVTINTEYGTIKALARHALPPLLAIPAPFPPKPVPIVHGPAAEVVVRQMVAALEKGELDRARLGADYSVFLTPTLLHMGAQSLRGWGAPRTLKREDTEAVNGMESSDFLLSFGKGKLEASLLRSPDGKVQEFDLSPAPK